MKNQTLLKAGLLYALIIIGPFAALSQTGFPIHSSSNILNLGGDTIKTTGTINAGILQAPLTSIGGITINGTSNAILANGTIGFGSTNLTTTGTINSNILNSSSVITDTLNISRILPSGLDSIIYLGNGGWGFLALRKIGPPTCTPSIATSNNGIFSFLDSSETNNVRVGIGTKNPDAVLNLAATGTACISSFPTMFSITNTLSSKDVVTMNKNGDAYFDGKVKIGIQDTDTPGNYRLYVKGGILTEHCRVGVDGTADWSDYVFAKNYSLPSLDSVENYISKNHHLKGVPSAEEVVKNGVDVTKMDADLLKKVEELTLYVIKLQKENDALKKQIDTLKN